MPQILLTYQMKAIIFLYQIMFMVLSGDLEFRTYEFKTYFPLLFLSKNLSVMFLNLYISSHFTNILSRRIMNPNFRRSFQFESKNMMNP